MSIAAYVAPHAVSLLVELGVAAYALSRHRLRSAAAFGCAVLGQAFWTFGYLCEVWSTDLAGKVFWDNLQLIGTVAWCVGFFYFALQFTQRVLAHPKLTAGAHILFWGSYLLLAFTDAYHGLIRGDAHLVYGKGPAALVYSFTWPTWLASVGFFACFGVSLAYLTAHALQAQPYRTQSLFIVLGTSVPMLGALLTLFGVFPEAYRDV